MATDFPSKGEFLDHDMRDRGEGDRAVLTPTATGELRTGISAIREEYDLLSSMIENLDGMLSPILGKGDDPSASKVSDSRAVASHPDIESSIGQDLHQVFNNFRALRARVMNIIERVRI